MARTSTRIKHAKTDPTAFGRWPRFRASPRARAGLGLSASIAIAGDQ